MIFQNLVLEYTHPRFFYSELGKSNSIGIASECHRLKNLIHLLLGKLSKFRLCSAHLCKQVQNTLFIFLFQNLSFAPVRKKAENGTLTSFALVQLPCEHSKRSRQILRF